ncbi:hypothetical protein O181_066776 [Austropuccinia psidii MF-1]|uniref:Uncharacterized protein n=1 Tax=Austropuccinia psidii MF-1 TaxID=1389203 RepID=A0A9Q3EYB5_9BASI|nr:hypothetical protein [Austropuccinia psidii MF-1]
MKNVKQDVQPGIPLGRTWRKLPEDLSQRDTLQISLKISKGWNPTRKRTAEPHRAYSASLRLTRSRTNKLSSRFTPFRHQQIGGQESPFFTITGSFQEKTRIQGQNQDHFQPKEERVRLNDQEAVGFGERSAQEPEVVVHNYRISNPINRNITLTPIEHNVITPESVLNNEESQTCETKARRTRACSKSRGNQNFTLDDIANTLQDIRKRTNIGKYSPYQRSGFKEKQPVRVEFKDKLKERVAEVTKKKNSFHNCGSTDHYASNCPKAKKKVYAIEKVPEDSESDSIGDAIREQSDEEQDPREVFLVEYKKETPLDIQDIQSEEGIPQDTANNNLCKHTQHKQTFLVTPTKGMAYIHGKVTQITF